MWDRSQNSSDSLSFMSFSSAATCALSTEISASMEAEISVLRAQVAALEKLIRDRESDEF